MKNKYNFDSRAKVYEKLKWVTDKAQIKKLTILINKYGGKTLLDLGIGTGIVETNIKKSIKVTGVDISSKMLRICKTRNPSFELINKNIKELPHFLNRRRFDMVFSRAVLGHMKIKPIIKSVKNFLTEKGKILLCESISYSIKDIQNQIQFHNLIHPGHEDFPTQEQFISTVENNGFTILSKEIVYSKCDLNSLFESINASGKKREKIQSYLSDFSSEYKKKWNIQNIKGSLYYRRPWLILLAKSKS